MASPPQTPDSYMRFKLILENALSNYQKKTKQNLVDYWLATEMKSCESIDGVLDIIRDQVEALERTSASDQRLMICIGSSVDILSAISTTLGRGIGLVFGNYFFDDLNCNSDVIVQAFPPASAIFAGISVLLSVRVFPVTFLGGPLTPKINMWQGMSKLAMMRSRISLGASMTFSSASRFISKVLRPLNCWKCL